MGETKIIIQGELTDLNEYLKAVNSSRYAGNDVKQDNTNIAMLSAMKSKAKKIEDYPVRIQFSWYSKNSRKDIDNVAFAKKFILDGLVHAKVLKDDSRKYVKGFSDDFFIDADNPRVEVVIN